MASRSRGTQGQLKATVLVPEWLLDRCDTNFISVCTMKSNLGIQESPSPEKNQLQTNSVGCSFSRRGWDYPKEAPSPTHSGIGSEKPISSKSECNCFRKLTKAGLEIPKETNAGLLTLPSGRRDPAWLLHHPGIKCSSGHCPRHHSAGTFQHFSH